MHVAHADKACAIVLVWAWHLQNRSKVTPALMLTLPCTSMIKADSSRSDQSMHCRQSQRPPCPEAMKNELRANHANATSRTSGLLESWPATAPATNAIQVGPCLLGADQRGKRMSWTDPAWLMHRCPCNRQLYGDWTPCSRRAPVQLEYLLPCMAS